MERGNGLRRVRSLAYFTCGILAVAAGAAYGDATLNGAVSETRVSGFKGTQSVIGDPDSTTYALYGLASRERSDNPCLLTALSENVNDSSKTSSAHKDLCGPKGATSSEIKADYGNDDATGKRTFLTGVQVCMNNDRTRVKGIRIRGNVINSDSSLARLVSTDDCSAVTDVHPNSPPPIGPLEYRFCGGVITEPHPSRTNCDDKDGWMSWAECPEGQIATAAVAHFEAGNTPRSLTGVALKCRPVGALSAR